MDRRYSAGERSTPPRDLILIPAVGNITTLTVLVLEIWDLRGARLSESRALRCLDSQHADPSQTQSYALVRYTLTQTGFQIVPLVEGSSQISRC